MYIRYFTPSWTLGSKQMYSTWIYGLRWKLMVNKSHNQKTKDVDKSNFDIDKKSLRGYVRDGCQMNLTPHLITCVCWALIFGGLA